MSKYLDRDNFTHTYSFWGRDQDLFFLELNKLITHEILSTGDSYTILNLTEDLVDRIKTHKQAFCKKGYLIVDTIEASTHANYRTVVHMKLIFEGTPYKYTMDFGYGYPPSSAEYMWFEGNYSCDCNKRLFLARTYPEDLGYLSDDPENPCTDTIEVEDFTIELVPKEPFRGY